MYLENDLWKKYFSLIKALGKPNPFAPGGLEGNQYLLNLRERLESDVYEAFVLALIMAYFHPENPYNYWDCYCAVCHHYKHCSNGCPLFIDGKPCMNKKNPLYYYGDVSHKDAYRIFGTAYTKAWMRATGRNLQ